MNTASASRLLVFFSCLLATVGHTVTWGRQTPASTGPLPSARVLTQVSEVLELSPKEADRAYPVRVQGVVTYYGGSHQLFIQDSTGGISVQASRADLGLTAGELVEVDGITSHGWFANQIESRRVKRLGRTSLPEPHRPRFDELALGQEDSQYVEITGIVRALRIHAPSKKLLLSLALGAGRIWVSVEKYPKSGQGKLLDSKISVRGVSGGRYNARHQMIGTIIYVQDMSFVQVLEPTTLTADTPPLESIRDIDRMSARTTSGHRVKVRGIVTLQRPFRALYIRDATESLMVETSQPTPVQPGDTVDVWGFPARGRGLIELQDAKFRKLGSGPPPAAVDITAAEALQGKYDSSLVRVQGRIFDRTTEGDSAALVVESGRVAFQVRVIGEESRAAMRRWETGSLVRITGICEVLSDENGVPRAFRLWVRSLDGVEVLKETPWWTTKRMRNVLVLLVILVVAAAAWVIILRKQVRAKTREVREWLRREAALTDRYRDLLENAIDMVYTRDLEGNFTSVNNTMVKVLGYTAQEALRLNVTQIVAPEYREAVRGALGTTVEEQGFADTGLELVTKYGARMAVEVRARLLYEDGKAVGVQGIARNVTARKKVEQQVRLQAAALEAAPMAIEITDDKGNILWVNPAFTALTGYALEEVVGGNPRLLKSGKQDAEFYGDMWNTILSGRIWRGEIANRRKDGTSYDEELTVTPVCGMSGDIAHFVAVAQDITVRKQVEVATRRAMQAAEEANRTKSEFLANMSHELRTPLNAVIGMTDLVLATDLDPEQRRNLELVGSSANSLLGLIDDILDFSKIEAGKLELESLVFNLADVMEEALRPLAVQAYSKGLEMVCALDPGLPPCLVGDPGRIKQVVVNLVENAIKFTEKGEVVIRARVKSHDETAATLQMTVTDTGVGIPSDKIHLVFEAFKQADGSLTRRFEGAGLGLAICSELVRMMGGAIWVESGPGRGSTFHVTFHLDLAPCEALPESEGERKLPPGVRVLVVDDHAASRESLAELLRYRGAIPTLAEDGEAALAAIREAQQSVAPFHLALIDAHLPGGDGFALAEHARGIPGFLAPILMMLPPHELHPDESRCRQLGIVGSCAKPVRESTLLIAMAKVLENSAGETARPSTGVSLQQLGRTLRVLVAENNEVSQVLVAHLLKKRGHQVSAAADGWEVLGAVQDARWPAFDLLLIDTEMPPTDGLEVTRRIRAAERTTGRRLPIIAMTAHPASSEEEACKAVGFDAYLSKPLLPSVLFETIQRVAEAPASTPAEVPMLPVFDQSGFLSRLEGDELLGREIIEMFLQEYPKLLEGVRQAAEQRNPSLLERTAHTLKGSVGDMSAPQAFEAACALQQEAKEGKFEGASAALATLEAALQQLAPELRKLGNQPEQGAAEQAG